MDKNELTRLFLFYSVKGMDELRLLSVRQGWAIDTRCSKTFLARLCEQAERYDGEFVGGDHELEERDQKLTTLAL